VVCVHVHSKGYVTDMLGIEWAAAGLIAFGIL